MEYPVLLARFLARDGVLFNLQKSNFKQLKHTIPDNLIIFLIHSTIFNVFPFDTKGLINIYHKFSEFYFSFIFYHI
jgi:hypothetical protein